MHSPFGETGYGPRLCLMYRQIAPRSDLGTIFVSKVVNLLIDIQLLPKGRSI